MDMPVITHSMQHAFLFTRKRKLPTPPSLSSQRGPNLQCPKQWLSPAGPPEPEIQVFDELDENKDMTHPMKEHS